MERIATITPIATRNTPFTISLMMPQRMPNTPKAVRIIKPHIANPMCCAICLKFAVAVISSLFLIFLFLMRIQELRELSFKLSYIIRKSKCSTDFKRNDFLKKTKRTHWVRFVHLNSLIESCVFLYLWNSPFDTFL